MSEIERQEFLTALEAFQEKVTKSKKASRDFLSDLGVFTKDGKLQEAYKNLCIPQNQG